MFIDTPLSDLCVKRFFHAKIAKSSTGYAVMITALVPVSSEKSFV